MATQEERKSRLAHLPGILGSAAALIAALTTVYVNLRGDRHEAAASAPSPAVVAAPGASSPTEAAPMAAPRPMRAGLRLDQIRVDNDGSMGSTDWVFEVDAADRPLFTLPMKGLSDREGDNLARIGDPTLASAEFEWPPTRNAQLMVKGWKRGLLAGGGAPEVEGSAWLADGVGSATITAKSAKPDGPAFVFYFSVLPEAGPQR